MVGSQPVPTQKRQAEGRRAHSTARAASLPKRCVQHISKYTEREIINHMKLRHPHVIALREVRSAAQRCALQ